jgi:hypothetical protein
MALKNLPVPAGGNKLSNSLGGKVVFLLRINANGDTLWTRRHASAGNDEANAVTVLSDGSIVWAGKWDDNPQGDGGRAVIVKCTPDGNACFSRNSSAGIFASSFQYESHNNPVLHLVNPHSRTDTMSIAGPVSASDLCANSSAENLNTLEKPELFPNPANRQFTIRCAQPVESLQICNPLGQIRHIDGNGKTEIILSEEIPGMYFLRIMTASGTFGRTIVVQH